MASIDSPVTSVVFLAVLIYTGTYAIVYTGTRTHFTTFIDMLIADFALRELHSYFSGAE